MKRLLSIFVLLQIGIAAFAAQEAPNETIINIRTNRFFSESRRMEKLAEQSYSDGDYDSSARYAEDATRLAAMSDLYVRQQVKIYVANNKMFDALERLAWADSSQARKYFPGEYNDAKAYYNLALVAKDAKKWDDTIDNADKVIQTLAAVVSPPENITDDNRTRNSEKTDSPLPSQYIVRPWDKFGDCFWNIAGRSWAYGDSSRWPLLYQANRKKLPDPNDPNLIETGMVMDIPSIKGEERLGLWDSGKAYAPLNK
ncbi:MAG: LysM peptidoglycan-binding domain-containing protein [Spirochaetales bacterium]|jgi:hypothetical protein|nr:LysM peptidoglycan-binding domain-containing protein [Spirochaetales bacterium]